MCKYCDKDEYQDTTLCLNCLSLILEDYLVECDILPYEIDLDIEVATREDRIERMMNRTAAQIKAAYISQLKLNLMILKGREHNE